MDEDPRFAARIEPRMTSHPHPAHRRERRHIRGIDEPGKRLERLEAGPVIETHEGRFAINRTHEVLISSAGESAPRPTGGSKHPEKKPEEFHNILRQYTH